MKAVDTNILIRSIVEDDTEQTVRADAELSSGIVLVTHTVLMEVEWVLRSSYRFSRAVVNRAISDLLALQNVITDLPELIEVALKAHAIGADFSDMIHVGLSDAADEFVTFDKRLASRTDGPSNLPIRLA